MRMPIWALCALPLLALAACSRDDDGHSSQPAPSSREGIYAPSAKIASVLIDGSLSESWTWQGDFLTTVTPYAEGQPDSAAASRFVYENGRIASVSDASSQLDYAYSDGRIASITVSENGSESLSAVPVRSADGTVEKLRVQVSGSAVNAIVRSLNMGGMGAKDKPLLPMPKALADGVEAEVQVVWNGSNISQTVTTFSVDLEFPLSSFSQLPFMDSALNASPELRATLAFMGDAQVNAVLVVADTSEFSYDHGHNPYFGFPGGLDAMYFSAANVLDHSQHGLARLELPSTLGMLLVQAVPDLSSRLSFPMQGGSFSYSYTYNADGFPTSRSDGSLTTEFIYLD